MEIGESQRVKTGKKKTIVEEVNEANRDALTFEEDDNQMTFKPKEDLKKTLEQQQSRQPQLPSKGSS